ncbi:hypothetical protein VCRA2133E348_70068 [Vibrio crassostreae]|nr:hypothetical protein VCRA2133E348_70068 [Vibrio crassostreae]CAK3650152.1 hypothetical protein VCRA213O314_70070 [Vibrio crassostreae]
MGKMEEYGELLDKLNLFADEIAFYRALVDNDPAVRELGDDNLRKLAIELTHNCVSQLLLSGKIVVLCALV